MKSKKLSSFMPLFAVWSVFCLAPNVDADPIVYAIAGVPGGAQLGTLDLSIGLFTPIGAPSGNLDGLGEAGGNLYGGNGNDLIEVNPTNGVQTVVGSGILSFGDGLGSTTSGLYGHDEPTTKGCCEQPFSLYSVDPSSGASALLGSTGITDTGSGTASLSTGSDTLYFAYSAGGGSFADMILYSLDTTTGAASKIGDTGIDRIDGIVFVDGTLYATAELDAAGDNNVYTLDPDTGEATLVAAITGLPDDGVDGIGGLVSISSTPEPSTFVLLAIGLAAASLRFRNMLGVGTECLRPGWEQHNLLAGAIIPPKSQIPAKKGGKF